MTTPDPGATRLRDHPAWPGIRAAVLARRGRDLAEYRTTTLERRLRAQMARRGAAGYDAYLRLLEQDPQEVDALLGQLSVKASRFFRDPEGLAVIVSEAFAGRTPADPPLRIWCAGCGRGEEPYSVAMTAFTECASRWSILATDVDAGAIAHAERGTYVRSALASVDDVRRATWFDEVPGAHPPRASVKPALRAAVTFRIHDLLSGEPPVGGPFDVLLCRNVLIYFERAAQARVQRLLRRSLAPRGVLWLGEAEVLIPELHGDFVAIDVDARVFRRR